MLALAFVLLFAAPVFAQAPQPAWLDKPLTNWNTAGRAIPAAKAEQEPIAELAPRCKYLPLLETTAGERALVAAGWVPFRMFDRQIVDRDVEIIGGLAGADGMCRPANYNVFGSSTGGSPGRCRRRRWIREATAASAARFDWPPTTRSTPASRATPTKTRSAARRAMSRFATVSIGRSHSSRRRAGQRACDASLAARRLNP